MLLGENMFVGRAHLEVFPQLRPDFRSVHAIVPPPVLVEGPVVVHDVDDRQAAAAPDLEVVRIVSWRHLQGARAKGAVHVGISNNGNRPVVMHWIYYT